MNNIVLSPAVIADLDLSAVTVTLETTGKPGDVKNAVQPINELLSRFDRIVENFTPADPGEPPALKHRKIGRYVYFLLDDLRDLPARAQVAGQMARNGFEVILGHVAVMSAFRFGDLPPGILVSNGLSKNSSRIFWHSACAGHLNVALNDDLLFEQPDIHPYAVRLADYIFSPNEDISAILRAHAPANKITTVGCPVPCRQELGDSQVICSTAKTINSSKGFERAVRDRLDSAGSINASELRHEIICEREDFDRAIDCYIELKRKSENVAFVAHPDEQLSTYVFNGISLDTLKSAARVISPDKSPFGRYAAFCGIPSFSFDGIEQESPKVSPSTIAENLETIWRQNQYPMSFHVERAWDAVGLREYTAQSFPAVADDEISHLAQYPVKRLSPNTWALLPHAA